MYPLGKQFEIDYAKAKCDKRAVVQGPNYRFSVIMSAPKVKYSLP